MELKNIKLLLLNVFPGEIEDQKAAYKSGEITDKQQPITLNTIKQKLKENGVFNWHDKSLNAREKKELSKLFEAVEIMTTSRARQPSNVQNLFSSLRIVERAAKKQLKEGQISESLAAKFNWDNLTVRHKKVQPTKKLKKLKKRKQTSLNSTTNMRHFNSDS